MHSKQVHDLAAAFAARVFDIGRQRDARNNDELIEIPYQLALSRSPTDLERQLSSETLRELQVAYPSTSAAKQAAALETFCHTLLNSAAFLYVD